MRPDEVVVVNNGEQRRAAETMSETSEGTATTSVSGKSGFESREELRDLAAVLGISDPEDLHQERFRVDRRKLEQMLLGEFGKTSGASPSRIRRARNSASWSVALSNQFTVPRSIRECERKKERSIKERRAPGACRA